MPFLSRVFPIVLLAALVTGCSSIRSGLEIDPGATFVLGGDQRGAFRVEVVNTGRATVEIFEATVFQDTVQMALIPPGGSASAHFSQRSAALVVNRGSTLAFLDVTIRGDTNLGMGYSPTD